MSQASSAPPALLAVVSFAGFIFLLFHWLRRKVARAGDVRVAFRAAGSKDATQVSEELVRGSIDVRSPRRRRGGAFGDGGDRPRRSDAGTRARAHAVSR